jgi:hypothetical protein
LHSSEYCGEPVEGVKLLAKEREDIGNAYGRLRATDPVGIVLLFFGAKRVPGLARLLEVGAREFLRGRLRKR